MSNSVAKIRANLESAFWLSGCCFCASFSLLGTPATADEGGMRHGKQVNKVSEGLDRT